MQYILSGNRMAACRTPSGATGFAPMTEVEEHDKPDRRAPGRYELLVPIAIVLLGLMLLAAIVLVAALAVGILPSK